MWEMTYFQKVRKCLLNIDGMLNILQKKDQNIYFTSDLRKGKKNYLHWNKKKQIDF